LAQRVFGPNYLEESFPGVEMNVVLHNLHTQAEYAELAVVKENWDLEEVSNEVSNKLFFCFWDNNFLINTSIT
jgi:hypothetical protein